MESRLEGRVICRQVRFPKSARSVIERHIQNWLGVHQPEGLKQSARYSVRLEPEGEGNLLNCEIEVQVGRRIWRGRELAHGIQQVLFKSLKRLAPVPA